MKLLQVTLLLLGLWQFYGCKCAKESDAGLEQISARATNADNVASVLVVSSPNEDATYFENNTVSITVEFSRTVSVQGSPTLSVNLDNRLVAVELSSAEGTTLTFDYVVNVFDVSSDLSYASIDALDLQGGSITDSVSGEPAYITLPSPGAETSLSGSKDIVIDGPGLSLSAAPTFLGLTGISFFEPSEALLRWNPATDDDTPQNEIQYQICYSKTAGACTSNFQALETVVGATSFVVSGLNNSSEYEFLVRAVDSSGVSDMGSSPKPPKKRNVFSSPTRSFMAGVQKGCYVLEDKTAQCWGSNWNGDFGLGTDLTWQYSYPVTLGISDIDHLEVGRSGICAIKGQQLYCAGNNGSDTRFTIGSDYQDYREFTVIPTANDVVDVSVNDGDTMCIVRSAGTVHCAGKNNVGQLGNGSTTSSSAFVQVTGISNAVEVDTSRYSFACARLATKSVVCWGEGDDGALGNGSQSDSSTPVPVSGISTAEEISLGRFHACARLTDGSVQCWGRGSSGQLGGANYSNALTPTTVLNVSNAVAVSTSNYGSCAVQNDGLLKCWGSGSFLGQGVRVSATREAQTVIGITNAVDVDLGEYFGLAKLADNRIVGWGSNDRSATGSGPSYGYPELGIVPEAKGMTSIAASYSAACIVEADNDINCTGSNSDTLLGISDTLFERYTFGAKNFNFKASKIAGQRSHFCASELTSGDLRCWGQNDYGKLGDGTTTSTHTPVSVGITSPVDFYASKYSTCAIISPGGGVKCWGRNNYGQVGNGATGSDVLSPADVGGGLSNATQIVGGDYFHCALLNDGSIQCWGRNSSGQLGNSSTTNSNTPVSVTGISGATAISASEENTCAILADKSVSCWGTNNYELMGTDAVGNQSAPYSVPGATNVEDIAMTYQSACVVHTDKTASCWGHNRDFQLGRITENRNAPVAKIPGVTAAEKIFAIDRGYCIEMTNGDVQCWGYKIVGNGARGDIYTPLPVTLKP